VDPGGQETYGSGTLPSDLLFGSEIIQLFKTEKFEAFNCITAQARQAQWREEAETALANLPDPDCPPGHVRQASLMSLLIKMHFLKPNFRKVSVRAKTAYQFTTSSGNNDSLSDHTKRIFYVNVYA
jgi:hypothetical protein